jgi:hypothetical protein
MFSVALFMRFMSFMVRLGDLDDLGALRASARKGLGCWIAQFDCLRERKGLRLEGE